MTDVYTERGKRVIFACAARWPGWCRKGRSEDAALAELAAYASRYAVVADRAGVRFDGAAAAGQFTVVERGPGPPPPTSGPTNTRRSSTRSP